MTILHIVERPTAWGDKQKLIRVGSVFSVDNPEGELLLPAGSMWREPELDSEQGECWAIVLPDGYIWRTNERGGDDLFWVIHGSPPVITVNPSIESPGNWHGRITEGELE